MRTLGARSDFARLFSMGTRHHRGGVTVVRAPAPDVAPETRVAVIAGRKVGGAVQRNRAKRRLREALRRVTLPEHEHLAIIAGRSVLAAPFPELVSWLADTLAAEVSV